MIRYILHYSPSKLIPGLINFLGLILYARIFTKEEYGRYAYVLAIVGLVQAIFFPWIRLSLTRYYQKHKTENKGHHYTHYTLFLFIIISAILISGWSLFLLISESESSIKILLTLGLPLMILNALFEQLMALSRAKLDSKFFAINTIFKSILKLGFVIFFVYLFHLNEIAIFLSVILTNLILIWYYIKKKIDFDYQLLKPNKTYRNEILNYGIPLTFSFLLVFIINSSDRIIIQYFMDSKAVGLYSLPYEISTFTITNIFMVFNMAFFPIIIKEYEQQGSAKSGKRIKQYFKILTMVVFPSAILIFLLAPYITGLIMGANYNTIETTNIIKLITIAGFLAGMKAYYFDLAFHLGNKTNVQIVPVAISGIINIIFNFYWIPVYGVIGAVYATVISYLFGLIISFLLGRKIMKIPVPLRDLVKVIIPSVILFLTLYYIPIKEITWFSFILNILIGGFVYSIFILLFNTAGIRTYLVKIRGGRHGK